MNASLDAAAFNFDLSRHTAAADLHPAHAEAFGRLTIALRAGPRSQFLFIEFRNQLYRDRLLARLDDVARDAKLRVQRFDLAGCASFTEAEQGLRDAASAAEVIEVLGGERWFNAARWRDFNVRRDAIAHDVAARLLIWVHPEQVPALVAEAPDLWAWRSGIYDFVEPQNAVMMSEPANWAQPIDNRSLAQRSQRMAELRLTLAAPDVPDSARVMLLDELAALAFRMGDLDEALRIRRDEQLPVFEKLGDVRLRTVTLGKMADVFQARGDLDEALRIRRDEQLPVFEKIGDVRERAVTLGKMADVFQARGELDEALRIRRDEQMPVYKKFGDMRGQAVTLSKMADVHRERGDLDEALRIWRDAALPVFEKLGAMRERALTLGRMADVYFARGELDKALRIRRDEQLPAFEKLGDVRERAVTLGKMADVFQARGELDEALRIRRDEELPVYEKLGDVHSQAVTLGEIADVFEARGDLDEALRIRRDEQLPVFERIGDVRSRALTQAKLGMIWLNKGDLTACVPLWRSAQADFARMKLPEAKIIGGWLDEISHAVSTKHIRKQR